MAERCNAFGARYRMYGWPALVVAILLLILSAVPAAGRDQCGDHNNDCLSKALASGCDSQIDGTPLALRCPAACETCTDRQKQAGQQRRALAVDAAGGFEQVESDDEDPNESSQETNGEEEDVNGGFSVNFEHRLDGIDMLAVEWDSGDGKRQSPVMFIKPNAVGTVNTFDGHVFRIRDVASDELVSSVRMYKDRFGGVVIDASHAEHFQVCKDSRADCPNMASHGSCMTDPGWMTVFCPWSCSNCWLQDSNRRCSRRTLKVEQQPGLRPGDLEAQFGHMVDRWPQYNPTVHSTAPWVVTFDNFLNDTEIEAILGAVGGQFARSTDQGSIDERGVQEKVTSTKRTSENAWCFKDCDKLPEVLAVYNRISAITGLPVDHFESFQVLRYQIGQRYVEHHDSAESDNMWPCGPRVHTFFLYLSDVEEGGETEFSRVDGLKIQPKKGSAVLWPSVMSDNPSRRDDRTHHAALPVQRGVKFAANTWIHLYNYRFPNVWGCTGSFE